MLIQNNQKDEGENIRQSQIILGVTVLTLGILSVGPAVRATEPPDGGTNGKPIGEAFIHDVGAPVGLSFQTTENLTLGAVTESPAEAAEAARTNREDGLRKVTIKHSGNMSQHSLGDARDSAERLRHCSASRDVVSCTTE